MNYRVLLTTLAVYSGLALATIVPGKTAQPAASGSQNILYVNPQQGTDAPSTGTSASFPFRTITYALQQAQPGTVIQLAPGNYQAGETFPLQIKPGVIVKGNESGQGTGVVIKGGGEFVSRTFARQNVTLLAGNNTQILGVTVTNPNSRGTGIWVESTNPLIRNSTFVNSKREGIFVVGTASPQIQNNRFEHNDANGLSVTGQAKGEIRGNVFAQTGFGLAIGGSAAPLVADNQIENNRSGVVVSERAQPVVQGNSIHDNTEYGLVAMGEARPSIGSNDFRNNKRMDRLTHEFAMTKASGSDPTRKFTDPEPTPSVAVAQAPTQSQTANATAFGCVAMGDGYATIARRGNSSIPQPMITWDRNLGAEFTPEKRCDAVTQRLNQLVAQNGGTLDNLMFTVGPVERNFVVCLVKDVTAGCNKNNLIFTMSRENSKNPTQVLQRLLTFSVTGSGNPVQESEGQPYASLAPIVQKLEPAAGLWFVNASRQ